MYKGYYFTAVILAAGSGKRMKTDLAKQFIPLHGRPMVYYSLRAFAESPVDSIVLVTSKEHLEYCQKEIVDKYNIPKVMSIIPGGEKRYHSSINGVFASPKESDYLLIHDCARPCITGELIMNCMENVIKHRNCTAAVKAVDTICQVDQEERIVNIPNRNVMWSIQTPQCFKYEDIKRAHQLLLKQEPSMTEVEKRAITDDVAVIRKFMEKEVFVFEGSYENIKVTNPGDVAMAEKKYETRGRFLGEKR